MTKLTMNSAFKSVKGWGWLGVAVVVVGTILVVSYAQKKMDENA
ncbi:MAG: hypothetical protein AAF705_20240 [Bacteroidota bacterium]